MYLDTLLKSECAGCGSCMSVCPRGAITMNPDDTGFRYPKIQESLCVHCDLCRSACGFVKRSQKPALGGCFGLKHKDRDVLSTSRSGGAFHAIAEGMIRRGGIVWGASLCEDMVVRHIHVDTIEELCRLQGSKYVQSDMEDACPAVVSQLKAGKEVLFSGTACQIAGLKAFLNAKRVDCRNLLTCDIVCQGVPSPKLFRDHLDYLREKHGAEITDFDFRDASRIGWRGHEESYVTMDGEKHFSREYSTLYYHYFMRESCFACPFAGLNRPADITLADFWGVREHYPQFYSDQGNSLVLVNTQKGMRAFQEAKQNADTIEVELEKVLQPRLCSPSKKPEGYEDFWKQYTEKGYRECLKIYGRESLKSKLVYTIKPLIRRLRG